MSHGAWLPVHQWNGLTPEQRHAALVHASDLRAASSSDRVYALTSAAAVWGLPRIEPWPTTVHVLAAHPSARGSRLVRPHVGAPARQVVRRGLRVTSAERTVVDLARTGSLVTAVAAADHALRYGLCTAEQLADEVAAVPAGTRGRRRCALVRDLADGDSMSPGESLSRVQMFRLNVPRPTLQGKREDAQGLIGYVDFEWLHAIGEFDGRVKYQVADGTDPREAAEVLWAEKRREDRLRRQADVGRWGWTEASHPERLRPVLADIGVHGSPRSSWFDLGAAKAG